MTAAERRRLVGTLGRVGSDHDGERAAAGLLATQMMNAAGTTWAKLLAPPDDKKVPELGTWRNTAASCLEQTGSLRPWEIGFLRDLPGFRRFSVKQRYVLNEIAARVLKDWAR